jgi:hypothetical protein
LDPAGACGRGCRRRRRRRATGAGDAAPMRPCACALPAHVDRRQGAGTAPRGHGVLFLFIRVLHWQARFVWNQHLLAPLAGCHASGCVLPVAAGFVKVSPPRPHPPRRDCLSASPVRPSCMSPRPSCVPAASRRMSACRSARARVCVRVTLDGRGDERACPCVCSDGARLKGRAVPAAAHRPTRTQQRTCRVAHVRLCCVRTRAGAAHYTLLSTTPYTLLSTTPYTLLSTTPYTLLSTTPYTLLSTGGYRELKAREPVPHTIRRVSGPACGGRRAARHVSRVRLGRDRQAVRAVAWPVRGRERRGE